MFSGGTARTIRSWASEIQISVYESPCVLERRAVEVDLGADRLPISPTAELKPPAPQSVIARKSPRSRAWRITSSTIFSVIALPICTAPPESDSLCAGQLGRAEGGAVDAVAAGAAADGDDPVAGLDLLGRHAAGQHADRAAEDQRIGQVARVDGEGAVDRGNAHAIAVVAHAGDDPLEDALRDAARPAGKRVGRSRSGGATQKTSVLQIGLAPRPGAERVADHAAEARVRAAVGVDRRGVVVRLDLEADVVLVVEPDDAGVVAEDAHQPVAVQLARRLEDRLLEQVVDRPPSKLDPALKRLVRAVLAPGLGQRLELAVGRVAAELGEVALDRLHLGQAERELA